MKKYALLLTVLLVTTAQVSTGITLTRNVPDKTTPAGAASAANLAPGTVGKKAALIDINRAVEKDLAALKGIGEVRAKAIVKARPYKGKSELVDKKIIPAYIYNDIKEQIIAK